MGAGCERSNGELMAVRFARRSAVFGGGGPTHVRARFQLGVRLAARALKSTAACSLTYRAAHPPSPPGSAAAAEAAEAARALRMEQQPPPLQLQDLPLCVLARVVRRVARTDGRAATALASTCRLLAAVAADELLVFSPLCRELAASCGAGVCVDAWSARKTRRPHAAAYVSLRLCAWLTASLWRGAGDDADRLYAFFWNRDGGVECTELDNASGCSVRRVCVCRVGGSSDVPPRARDGPAAMDVLRLDCDRVAVRVPPTRAAVSAVAAVIAGKCASPVGSPSSNFALEYLQHTHTLVRSRETRRRARAGGQPPADFALLRAARLEQLSLALRTSSEDAAVVEDAAAGVTRVRCSKHAACTLSLYWLRGGRLLACCTAAALLHDVRHIALPSP